MSFESILRRGQKKFVSRPESKKWGVCEYCDTRCLLFIYQDKKDVEWHLCEGCTDMIIKEEEL